MLFRWYARCCDEMTTPTTSAAHTHIYACSHDKQKLPENWSKTIDMTHTHNTEIAHSMELGSSKNLAQLHAKRSAQSGQQEADVEREHKNDILVERLKKLRIERVNKPSNVKGKKSLTWRAIKQNGKQNKNNTQSKEEKVERRERKRKTMNTNTSTKTKTQKSEKKKMCKNGLIFSFERSLASCFCCRASLKSSKLNWTMMTKTARANWRIHR